MVDPPGQGNYHAAPPPILVAATPFRNLMPIRLLPVLACLVALVTLPTLLLGQDEPEPLAPPPSTTGEGAGSAPRDRDRAQAGDPEAGMTGIDLTIEDPDGSWRSWETDVPDLDQPERLRRCRVFVVPHRFSITHSGASIGNLRLSGDRLVVWQGLRGGTGLGQSGGADDSNLLEFFAAGNVRLEWERVSVPLAGQSFAFAGDLGALTLSTATARVTNLGGTIHRQVSRDTDYLVAGREVPESVIEDAQRAGAEILDVDGFLRLLDESRRDGSPVIEQSHLLRAEEVFISLTNGISGVIRDVKARLQHPTGSDFYFQAKEIRVLSVNDAIGEDAIVSITPFALPWLHIRAKRLRWRQRENDKGSVRVIDVQNTGLYFGNTRIAPMFDLDQNLDRSAFIRSLAFNQSDRFGFSIFTDLDFGLLIHDNILGKTFDDTSLPGRIVGGVNLHSQRGVAPWGQLSYGRTGDRNTGFIDGGILAWYIKDSGDDTDFGRDRGFFPLERSDRLRVRLWHHQEFPLGLALNFQLSFFSDGNLLQEFFRNEFDAQANQQSYIDLTRYDSRTGVRVLWQRQVNKYEETQEYEPRVQFFLYPSRLFDLPFTDIPVYLFVQADIARAKIKPAADSNDSVVQSTRLDLQPGVTIPFDLGFLGFYEKAFVGLSWYGWDLDLNDVTLPDRVYAENQIGMWTQIYRTFAGYSSLFDVEGMRHIIRPELVFVHRFPPTFLHRTRASDIPQFDEIDEPISATDRIDLILSTRLQGLRAGRGGGYSVVDLIKARAEVAWFPNGDRDNDGQNFGPLFASFLFAPRPWFKVSGDLAMDLGTGVVSRYGVAAELVIELPWGGTSIDRGFPDKTAASRPLLRFQLSHRIVRDTSTISGFSAAWRASPVYAMQFYGEYDFRAENVRNVNVSVQRTFQEFVLTFIVKRDFIRDDTSVLITFAPFVLGEAEDVVTAGLDPTFARTGQR